MSFSWGCSWPMPRRVAIVCFGRSEKTRGDIHSPKTYGGQRDVPKTTDDEPSKPTNNDDDLKTPSDGLLLSIHRKLTRDQYILSFLSDSETRAIVTKITRIQYPAEVWNLVTSSRSTSTSDLTNGSSSPQPSNEPNERRPMSTEVTSAKLEQPVRPREKMLFTILTEKTLPGNGNGRITCQ